MTTDDPSHPAASSPPRGWTREQVEALRREYPRLGAKRAAPMVGKSTRAVAQMAEKLGVRSMRTGRGARWTSPQLRALADGWQVLSRDELLASLAPHPWYAVVQKARRLGLRQAVPAGLETGEAAAARTGYDYWTLRRLLARQHVTAHRLACYTRAALYDPQQVDRAVARDLAGESIDHAARRLRVCRARLARAAKAAGVRVVAGANARLDERLADALAADLSAQKAESFRTRAARATAARVASASARRAGAAGGGGGRR